jgi:hypothetical protein
MFNVIVRFPRYEQVIPCVTYASALDRQQFEAERYPAAVVTVEPSF